MSPLQSSINKTDPNTDVLHQKTDVLSSDSGAFYRRTEGSINATGSVITFGFSLVELLVTISIAAILLSLAAPSFTSFINKNRLATASDELIASLGYARSEALKRRTKTTLCARSTAGTLCDTTGIAEDYAAGWLIFLDCNNNNSYDTTLVCDTNGDGTLDSPDELLRITDAIEGDVTISGDAQHTANIQFGLSGRVLLGAASFDIQSDGTTVRTLAVNRSGSAYFD